VERHNSFIDGNLGEWLVPEAMNMSKTKNDVEVHQPRHHNYQIPHVKEPFYPHLHVLLSVLENSGRGRINKLYAVWIPESFHLDFLVFCVCFTQL